MAQKLREGPQSRAPLKWGEGAKNLTASRHLGCLNKVPFNNQSKEETEEKGGMMMKTTEGKRGRPGIVTWNVRTLNKEDKLVAIKEKWKGIS